jgi:hypothetical protein
VHLCEKLCVHSGGKLTTRHTKEKAQSSQSLLDVKWVLLIQSNDNEYCLNAYKNYSLARQRATQHKKKLILMKESAFRRFVLFNDLF